MKAVILAGGYGTRLREETEFKPKPMVEVGGRPILWHIMKTYAHYGLEDFVICLGYKGDVIRDYFLNYQLRNADVTLTLGSNDVEFHNGHTESGWKITLVETGLASMTGGRIRRAAKYLRDCTFMATYGDAIADVNVNRLLECHQASGKLATVTAVRPSSRFGELSLQDGLVKTFEEKPQVQNSWINGGYFVFESEVLDLISGDEATLESDVLGSLAADKQLAVFQHDGFWQCMDTYREMQLLNKMWANGTRPWAVWEREPQSVETAAAAALAL